MLVCEQTKYFLFMFPVQYYQEFACSAAIHGNGSNVEYALHLLCMAKGNIQVNNFQFSYYY